MFCIFFVYIHIYILELDCTYPCAGLSGIVTACWLRSNCRLDPRGSTQIIKSQPQNHCHNELELNATSTQHQAKYQPKISSKIDPNSTQHLPRIDPKSAQNRRKIVPKSAPGPTWAPRPFLNRFWTNFGSNLGPSWGPSWGHAGAMLAKKLILGGS